MSIVDLVRRRDGINRLLKYLAGKASGNAPVMMMLGDFKFSVNTAVFQEWQKSQSFRWQAQERFRKVDALQFTGYGIERITLPCIVYTNWRGIISTDDILMAAPENRPQRMISAQGDVMGRYVIESIEETHSYHQVNGVPRKIEFTLTLRGYD